MAGGPSPSNAGLPCPPRCPYTGQACSSRATVQSPSRSREPLIRNDRREFFGLPAAVQINILNVASMCARGRGQGDRARPCGRQPRSPGPSLSFSQQSSAGNRSTSWSESSGLWDVGSNPLGHRAAWDDDNSERKKAQGHPRLPPLGHNRLLC